LSSERKRFDEIVMQACVDLHAGFMRKKVLTYSTLSPQILAVLHRAGQQRVMLDLLTSVNRPAYLDEGQRLKLVEKVDYDNRFDHLED